ncbi:MAG: 3-deoxy-manno-octulosonate cytidylyltransferase [Candidatus Hydrogenedentales bacterium]
MSNELGPQVLAVIPARYASTRFPGKVIAPLAGKPLVVHTYERTRRARLVAETVIATDDARVVDAVAPYGCRVVMTRPDHPSGTDRIAEVAERYRAEIIVNVQGDEPLIDPATIDATIRPLLEQDELPMATARVRLSEWEDVHSPHVVKVVCDAHGRALYFSRAAIPFVRDAADFRTTPDCYWQHVGLYVYRRAFLLEYAQWAPTPLEKLEKLEQLRVLEHGHSIAVVDTGYRSIGVDTADDLERVRGLLERELAAVTGKTT